MITKQFSVLLSCTLLLAASCFSAAQPIDIALDAPQFSFAIENNLSPHQQEKLSPTESQLAQQLKPLLKVKDYSAVLALLDAHQAKERSAALWLMTGQVNLALGKKKQAATALNEALKVAPNLVRAHRTLAALHIQQQQFKQAQTHLAKAIEHGMQDPQLFGQLAYINLNQGAPWSAIAGYQQALLLQPHHTPWKKGLLYALQQAGNHQAAFAMANELLNGSPTDKDLWLARAQTTLALDLPAKAITSMEMALRHGENKPSNLLSTAQLHLANGSIARGADLLITLGVKKSQSFSQLEPAIAWLIANGQQRAASLILSKISNIKRRPTLEQSLYYATLGHANEHDNPQRALKYFTKSLSLNPNQASVLLKLAQHYQDKQQYSRAELYYQRAEIFPNYTKLSLAGLAQLALDQQYFAKALTYLEKLKQLSDNKLAIEKNITIIKRLQAQQA